LLGKLANPTGTDFIASLIVSGCSLPATAIFPSCPHPLPKGRPRLIARVMSTKVHQGEGHTPTPSLPEEEEGGGFSHHIGDIQHTVFRPIPPRRTRCGNLGSNGLRQVSLVKPVQPAAFVLAVSSSVRPSNGQFAPGSSRLLTVPLVIPQIKPQFSE